MMTTVIPIIVACLTSDNEKTAHLLKQKSNKNSIDAELEAKIDTLTDSEKNQSRSILKIHL